MCENNQETMENLNKWGMFFPIRIKATELK